jgi:hypothetical protein
MTISGQVQILQCLQFLEVTYQQQRFSHRPEQASCLPYVMAKLETTLPHSSIPKQHTFVPVMYGWTKSFRSVTGVGLRTKVPGGLSDGSNDLDQSAVVDSLWNWFRDAVSV